MNSSHPVTLVCLLGLGLGLGLWTAPNPVAAQSAQVADPTASPRPRPNEPITLNFVNAEIEAVARAMGVLTGRNVIVDPRVRGTLNLVTERPVTPAAAFNQFSAALRLQSFAVVESGGIYKVVPEAEAKLQGATVNAGSASPQRVGSGLIVTQIFRLNHEPAANLVAVLRPLISPNNIINVSPTGNALVITDYADNLHRLGRIIAALDVAEATGVEVIPIRHLPVTDITPTVQRLLEVQGASAPGGAGGAGGSDALRTVLIAEPRSNVLLVRAPNAARMELVRSLVANLDQPSLAGSNGAAGNIYVVYLKNAEANAMAATLRAALAGGGSAAAPAAAPGGAAATPVASRAGSTGGQIQADTATNSLVITATEAQYRQLRAVIDKLDGRRAQVFVESLIAEVNSDKAAEFGIQWQGTFGRNGDSLVGYLGSNFGTGGGNILSLQQNAGSGNVNPGRGLNFGVARDRNGVYVLGFLARFLEETGAGNILSTPTLLTLDNEEAKIVIGQNVPFVTGQFTNTGGSNGSVNPFQTIERKDVGLTLRVRPQISESGTVRLQIFQEVSSVQASSVNSATGLITNKRSIESNVLVEDGAIVVLGGLLQDEFSGNQEKVPGLGDVPFFGNLFRSEARSRRKTNLMVFLRPVVVRDSAATDALTLDRYDLMRAGQQGAQPKPSTLLGVNEGPVLPAMPNVRNRANAAPTPPVSVPEAAPANPAPAPAQ